MKTNISRYYISAIAVSLFYSAAMAQPAQGDPLMDRTGSTLGVFINGTATASIAEKKITDSENNEAYVAQWSAASGKGPLCFRIQTKDARLGIPEKIDLQIHQINPQKPYQQWRTYQTEPSTASSAPAFSTEQGFCPKEYFLTERLRFPELPPGEYMLRVAYWGVGNWDRQDVLFTVKP